MSANIEAIRKKQEELDALKQQAINQQLQIIEQAQKVLDELGYKKSGKGRPAGSKNKATKKATKKRAE